MKHVLIACAAASALGLLNAQEVVTATPDVAVTVADTKTPEEVMPTTTYASKEKSVKQMFDEILEEKDWETGYNKKANGEPFCVMSGYATVKAPVESATFITARQAAFAVAMEDARKNMAAFLRNKITSELKYAYKEGSFQKDDQEAQNIETFSDKVKALIHAKLDKALREEGIDPYAADTAKIAESAQKILASEVFQQSVQSETEGYIAGLQAVYTCESTKTMDGKVEIGVLALWSGRLQEMATSIMTGEAQTAVQGKLKIRKQIPKGDALISTFGVRQMVNERGEYVLVSFAQVGLKEENSALLTGGREAALRLAEGQLKAFAGSQLVAVSKFNLAYTYNLLEGNVEDYKDTSNLLKEIEEKASTLEVEGALVIRDWEAKHPLNGRTICGCVLAWSPNQMQIAAELSEYLEKAPRERVKKEQKETKKDPPQKTAVGAASEGEKSSKPETKAAPKTTPKKVKPQPKPTASKFSAGGLCGDEDAF